MKKLLTMCVGLGLAMAIIPSAQARVFVGVGYGYGYPAYPYYTPYYYPGYYAPPPVVYAVPSAPPPVVYAQPTVVYPSSPATTVASQTSPTFTDNLGRTCREFQSTTSLGPTYGTACLQPDGTWRVTQ